MHYSSSLVFALLALLVAALLALLVVAAGTRAGPEWNNNSWAVWRRTAHFGSGYERSPHRHSSDSPDRPHHMGGGGSHIHGGGRNHGGRMHGGGREGLIAFSLEKGVYESAVIDLYDPARAIYKLTDSLYFDNQNGNLIEVLGRAKDGSSGEPEISGIKGVTRTNASIFYTARAGSNNQVVACAESRLPEVASSNKWFSYASQGITNPDKYLVCYAAWGTYTYLHIIHTGKSTTAGGVTTTTPPKHVSSHRIPSAQSGAPLDNAIVYDSGQSTVSFHASINVGGPPLDLGADRAPPIAISGYAHEVYRVGTTAYFDVTNGYLVFADPGNLDIGNMYDRWGAPVSPTSALAMSTTPRLSFTAFCVVQREELFVYMGYGSDTVIICIRNSSSDVARPVFQLSKVSLYNQTGVAPPSAGAGSVGSAGGGNSGGASALSGNSGGGGMDGSDSTLLSTLLLMLLSKGGSGPTGAGGDMSGGGGGGGGGSGVTPVGQAPLPRVPGPATALTTTGAIVDLNDYVLKSSILAPVFPITSVVALPPDRQSGSTNDKKKKNKLPPGAAPAEGDQLWSGVWPGSQRVTSGGNPNSQSVFVAGSETTNETSDSTKQDSTNEDSTKQDSTNEDTSGFTGPRRGVRGVNPLSAFGALAAKGANFRPSAATIFF